MKLTNRSLATNASLTDLIHIVKTGDTTQNAAGSSFKIPMSEYAPLFGGGGTTYWSASTGTNAIVVKNSNSLANGILSLAEGRETQALGAYSHAEGYQTTAGAQSSHAEGNITTASGTYSHAEGVNTIASGNFGSHAEGTTTLASGQSSHAEGSQTTASGTYSHSEGGQTTASGQYSHAGGNISVASGQYSFVHGFNSTAGGNGTIVLGNIITGTQPNTTYVETLAITTLRNYVNDAAADADTSLASGGLYTTSGTTGRAVYRKP